MHWTVELLFDADPLAPIGPLTTLLNARPLQHCRTLLVGRVRCWGGPRSIRMSPLVNASLPAVINMNKTKKIVASRKSRRRSRSNILQSRCIASFGLRMYRILPVCVDVAVA